MTTAEYRSRYACTDIEDYEFSCSVADCPEVSHQSEDFQKCESCAMFLCSEHALYMLNDAAMPLCVTCAQCTSKGAHCDGTAAFLCDGCGAPSCWNCTYRIDRPRYVPFGGSITLNYDGSWPMERSYYCRACYREIPEDEEVQEVADVCPF